jgi:AhpC/TSA antioxidant enzyme
VRSRYGEFRALGAEVLAVAATPPGLLAAWLREFPQPFLVTADPDRTAYRAFGLGRTSWGAFFRPRVLFHYLRLIARGWAPRRTSAGADVLQLGGDFVLDGGGRVVFAYRSADPTDRPAVEELLRAVRTAASTR